MQKLFLLAALALVAGLMSLGSGQPVAASTTLVVDDDGVECPNPDYNTIQAAVGVAIAGDTVMVCAGTYYENITLKSGVIVQGAGAGVTTIDGGGSGRVVTATNVNSAARLDGFTITNGAANEGAGIRFRYSSPTISNCVITNNSASARGGGIHAIHSSSPTISNCIIADNSSGIYGGGIYAAWYSHPTITDSIISGNSAILGGGIDVYLSSHPTISNSIIAHNNAREGGGINVGAASPTIINSTITGNSAERYGGGIYADVSSLTVSNSIISGNSAASGGGIYAWRQVSPTFNYNDVWGNSPNDYSGSSAGPSDISQDPLFVNPGAGDYHLQAGSPAIDAGSNAAVPSWLTTDFEGNPRIWDGDDDGVAVVDMGAFEYILAVIQVAMDIKPGSDPNSINPKSKGVIPVAILGSNSFDVTDVDVTSLELGPGEATPAHDLTHPLVYANHLQDVNGDGFTDLVSHYRTQETGIAKGDTEACLTAQMTGGVAIEGCDAVRTIGK